MADNSDLTIERYADQISYPANQNEIIDYLRQQGAPEEMVRRIQELPKYDFRSEEELRESFHGKGTKWTGGYEKKNPDRDLPPR